MEDYKVNKRHLNYKRRGRPKMDYFWSPNKGYGKKRRRKKKKRKKWGKAKPRYGFYDFWYGYYMESEDLMVLYGILGNFMSSKPRV